MSPRSQGRSWRLFRIYFRRFRILTWLVILALLGGLLYLNQIGLPDFVKEPLLEKLHARGIDLQFSRLRLHFYRGIVADNVLFGRADDPTSPKLSLKEVQVRLDYRALLARQVQVSSLLLRQGHLSWPIIESNRPPRELSADDIQSELRFLPGDLWQLQPFQATFAGARLQLFVTITNATAMRDWQFFQAGSEPESGRAARLREHLRQLAEVLEAIHFAAAPELNLQISGDARNLASFGAQLHVRAPGARSPWGTFSGGALSAHIIPAKPQELPSVEIFLSATNASARWARAGQLELAFHALAEKGGTNYNADLDLAAAWVGSKWGSATNLHFTAEWLHSPANAMPLSGRGQLHLARALSLWGSVTDLGITGWLSTPTPAPAPPDPAWGFWTNLAPYALNLDCRAGQFDSPKLTATNILCGAIWRAPQLQLSRLSANLYAGGLVARANLNVDTRKFSFSDSSDFDVQQVSPLLMAPEQHWLSQIWWEKPPRLDVEGGLTLPAWTNRSPDWRAEVRPTVKLQGQAAVGRGAFHGIPFESSDSHFNYTNLLWCLPDLVVTSPAGRLAAFLESDDGTQGYYFRIQSGLDPKALRPLLSKQQADGFDLAVFSEPPRIDGEIRGRWREPDSIGVKARVWVTNFTFRGETATGLQSEIEYTNGLLKFTGPRLERGSEQVAAASVSVDLVAQKVCITNAAGSMDPQIIARAIGPVAGRWFEPYHFLDIPSGQVEGIVPFNIKQGVDLHFTVNGGAFEWWKFKVPRITGQVDWVGNRLALREVRADFYRGSAEGGAEFDFSPVSGNGLRFEVAVTNADLHLLMNDLSPRTNRLAGLLAGRLTITDGNTDDLLTWRGQGRAHLHDGLIWEIPAIGIFSFLLDSISPGLGRNRGSEAGATFVISNGLVRSENLEVRATTMRMKYRGTVDFDGKLNAVVEAELLRDTWVVGRLFSFLLWPVSKVFEYKVTGTLAEPKVEPLLPVIPKLILLPLHPLDTVKELLPKLADPGKTNAPPFKP